jgi:general secretion pathway protein E
MIVKSGLRLRDGHALELSAVLDALQEDKLITDQQRQDLTAQNRQGIGQGEHPLVRISEQGWQTNTVPAFPLTLEYLTRWLAEQTGLPYYRIDPLKIDVESVTNSVSQAYASRFHFLPVEINDKLLTVATAEPSIRQWETELSHISRRKIQRVIANPKDVERYLVEFFGVSRSLFGASSNDRKPISDLTNLESLTELGKVGEPDANDQHIVHIVDWLLQYAFEQRASDIHLEPRRDKSNIRFRIDGVLHQVHEVPTKVMGAITSRLKTLGRMNIADKRRPQDGRIKTLTPAGTEVEMRLSTMPTSFGEKMVLRIFDPQYLSKSFAELGFTRQDREAWEEMAKQPNGIILVTGPTGSGKTTTLYSTLKQLASPRVNICTIEDPIEMIEPQFNQMQVQPNIEVDFASGIRTLLRQDPDIIMIGEIRDAEPANIAIQAALTGHLVLSTLHTNDAPSAITRLMDIGIQPFLISATLLGVVAQRLVRTLCPHCKEPSAVNEAAWKILVAPKKIALPKKAFRAVGCDECRNTGFLGRMGLYEILTMSPVIRNIIRPGVSAAELRNLALENGMRTLRLSGANKVAAGLTTLEEVFTVVSYQDGDMH